MRLRIWTALAGAVLVAAGCRSLGLLPVPPPPPQDLTEGRLLNIKLSSAAAGAEAFLFLAFPRVNWFLEGMIQGLVVDESGRPVREAPVEGVFLQTVRDPRDWTKSLEAEAGISGSGPTIVDTDASGVYRLPFRVALTRAGADVRGRIKFANDRLKKYKSEGRSPFEPWEKETGFRIVYDADSGNVVFAEDPRRDIVTDTR